MLGAFHFKFQSSKDRVRQKGKEKRSQYRKSQTEKNLEFAWLPPKKDRGKPALPRTRFTSCWEGFEPEYWTETGEPLRIEGKTEKKKDDLPLGEHSY